MTSLPCSRTSPRSGVLEAGDRTQQRRLARARRPEHDQVSSPAPTSRSTSVQGDGAPEAFLQAAHAQEGLSHQFHSDSMVFGSRTRTHAARGPASGAPRRPPCTSRPRACARSISCRSRRLRRARSARRRSTRPPARGRPKRSVRGRAQGLGPHSEGSRGPSRGRLAQRDGRARARGHEGAVSSTSPLDQVHARAADESGHEQRGRTVVDLDRRADLHASRPSSMTTMRSASRMASSWSWVT